MPSPAPAPSVDAYIAGFPPRTRKLLKEMRSIVRSEVPEAKEVIGYGIPTFRVDGKNLVHFAGYERHVGFYPGAAPILACKAELTPYKSAKGSVQFPLDQPLPEDLIRRLVALRMAEHSPPARRRT